MKKKIVDYGFAPAIRSMLNILKKQNKDKAIFTMEQVGEFENCNIIITVIRNRNQEAK